MKYGLMSYNYTTNLGNEIQSIASRRFLPTIDYYIEHEKIHQFDEDSNVKMIMCGWYLDCADAWPPSDNIDPLLISMHFTTTTLPERRDAILTDESRDFFKRHGPVGCRDYHTVDFLKKNGIDAYYTGCLTLTLDSGNGKIPTDENDDQYIVISVENPQELYLYLKERTDKRIVILYQDMIPSYHKAYPKYMKKGLYTLTSLYDYKEKLFMAENLLKIYENAFCVITDRIHCALPCLAFETPVLFLQNKRLEERFNGIANLFNKTSLDEYYNNYNHFDVDNPCENPKDYLPIREKLINQCREFTGTVNDSCYSDISYQELLLQNSMILSRNAMETRKYIGDIVYDYKGDLRKNKRQKKTIKKQKKIIEEKDLKIKEMESSASLNMSKPFKSLKDKFRK